MVELTTNHAVLALLIAAQMTESVVTAIQREAAEYGSAFVNALRPVLQAVLPIAEEHILNSMNGSIWYQA